ncbi:type IV pilus modification PilV family protein, partial [Kaarinaea lacus]
MKSTHRGISLVEVLVALAVMGTGLIAVAAFQTDLISGSGSNKARAEALALAQERIEEFQNYSAVTLDKDNPEAVIPDAEAG